MHEMIETLAVLGPYGKGRTRYLKIPARRNMRLECWGSDGWLKGRSRRIKELLKGRGDEGWE